MRLSASSKRKRYRDHYNPYGKATITRGGTAQSSDPLGQRWTFTGRFLDEESGLLYYRARYYDPPTGRFLQRDTKGYSACPGLFAYVGSNPVNDEDPSGLESDEEAKAARAKMDKEAADKKKAEEQKKAILREIRALEEELGPEGLLPRRSLSDEVLHPTGFGGPPPPSEPPPPPADPLPLPGPTTPGTGGDEPEPGPFPYPFGPGGTPLGPDSGWDPNAPQGGGGSSGRGHRGVRLRGGYVTFPIGSDGDEVGFKISRRWFRFRAKVIF